LARDLTHLAYVAKDGTPGFFSCEDWGGVFAHPA
jgi:hypothetical protein